MDHKTKQLLFRLIFLGLFALTILGVYWMAKSLSNSQEPVSTDIDGFIPSEAGKAVLVEYSDFQCPACRMYYPLVKKLKTDLGDKLVFVYKYFPLSAIHKNADLSARAGEASRIQDKFLEMHDLLFEKQDEWAESKEALALFTEYAVGLGLDKEMFLKNIDSSEVKSKVVADYQEGVRLGISGTPTFFLNGKKINNPQGYDQFKSIIEQSIK